MPIAARPLQARQSFAIEHPSSECQPPLTLILRRFNFDTLATRAFQLATDEQLAQSAVPALLIIAVELLPVVVLNKLIGRRGSDAERP